MKTMINSQNLRTGILTLIIISLSVFAGCKKSSDTPGANEVFIDGMAFNPGTITVSENTTITWTNKDPVDHTVTSDNGLFDSGNISSGGTYSHLFTTAGSYPYYCTIHPSMTGTVVVN